MKFVGTIEFIGFSNFRGIVHFLFHVATIVLSTVRFIVSGNGIRYVRTVLRD